MVVLWMTYDDDTVLFERIQGIAQRAKQHIQLLQQSVVEPPKNVLALCMLQDMSQLQLQELDELMQCVQALRQTDNIK